MCRPLSLRVKVAPSQGDLRGVSDQRRRLADLIRGLVADSRSDPSPRRRSSTSGAGAGASRGIGRSSTSTCTAATSTHG